METNAKDFSSGEAQERQVVLECIRQRWQTLPSQSAEQLQDWKEEGRP